LIYPGFITEGKLAAVLIKPSLGVSNWPVIYIINTAPPVTTKELYFYDVRFELEEVVEEGWLSDENLMQTLDESEDIISDSANRENKGRKTIQRMHR
jgi:hypothetical protein